MYTSKIILCTLIQICIRVMPTQSTLRAVNYDLYSGQTGQSLGMTVLKGPMTNSSLLLCAAQCTNRAEECYSFTYNHTSRLCTLGRQVSTSSPALATDHGQLYIKHRDCCDTTQGFQLWTSGNTSTCAFVSNDSLSFDEAEVACQDKGGHLLTIPDVPRSNLVDVMMSEQYDQFWVGIDDRQTEGQYVWSHDGSPVSDFVTVEQMLADVCNATLTERTGVIVSPNYPVNYPDDCFCTWTIKGDGNAQSVSLRITDILMEGISSSICDYDHLKVYDGDNDTAVLMGDYCGDTNPGTLNSTGPSMHIVFTSDFAVTYRGFRATYTINGQLDFSTDQEDCVTYLSYVGLFDNNCNQTHKYLCEQ